MADDPDALWKPGSDRHLRFDRVEPRPFVVPDDAETTLPARDQPGGSGHRVDSDRTDRDDVDRRGDDGARTTDEDLERVDTTVPSRSPGRIAALAVVAAVTAGAGVAVVLGGALSEPMADPVRTPVPLPTPVPSTFPIGDSRGDVPIDDAERASGTVPIVCSAVRLPTSAEERWTVSIDEVWNLSGPLAAGSGGVAALTIDTPEPDASFTLRMFDALDGSQRWRRVADVTAGSEIVAVVADVVIVESAAVEAPDTRVLTGFDADTGLLAWTETILPGTEYLIDPASQSVVVEDSDVGGPAGAASVTVLDAADGGFRIRNGGRFVGLAADRRLVTLAGSKFLFATDAPFRSGLIGVTAVEEPVATVFGTGVLIAEGDPGPLRLIDIGTDGGRHERSVPLVGSENIDPPSGITSLTALGDEAVIVTGRGALHGAVLDEGGLRIRWRVDGVLSSTAPSDRGATLLVFSDGGALQRLVDAATGRKFLDVPTVGGALSVDDLFSNGVVVRGGSGTAAVRSAYDLDGELMWRLPRWGSLAVGDRVVYDTRRAVGTATEPPSISVSIVAFGPVVQGPPACDQRRADDGELVES